MDYRQNGTSYQHVGLWGVFRATIGEDGGAERLSGANVTADLFDVLGVKPMYRSAPARSAFAAQLARRAAKSLD